MTDQHEEEMDESISELMDYLESVTVQVNAGSLAQAINAMYQKNCLCDDCDETILNLETSLLSIDCNDQWKQMTINALRSRSDERSKAKKQRDAFVAKLQRLFESRKGDAGSAG